MRSRAVSRTERRGDLLRILRPHARVYILAPIAVGTAVESTFTDGCEIVWNTVRAEFVAFVHHCLPLTRFGLKREGRWSPEDSTMGLVRGCAGMELPNKGTVCRGAPYDMGDHQHG